MRVTETGDKAYTEVNLVLIFLLISIVSILIPFVKIELSDNKKRFIEKIFLLAAPLLCVLCVEWINDSYVISNFRVDRWIANYLCDMIVFSVIFAVFRKTRIVLWAGSLFCVGFGIINYFTTEFRGIPILPWDIKSLGTAADVAGTYEFKITYRIAVATVVLITFLLISSKFSKKEISKSKKEKRYERLFATVICAALIVLLFPVNLLSIMQVDVWPWNQKASTKMTGISAGFIGNLHFVMVDKPEGYCAEYVEEIKEVIAGLEEQPKIGQPEKQPTVIAIMNESFTDMNSYYTVALSEDPKPSTRALMVDDNTYSGTAYASVTGGSTCDSEFEFLTSNTMSFLPTGSKPYQQYIKSDQTSIVSTLESYGYDSVAIHPGKADAWHRSTVYPFLGFDKFIPALEFTEKRVLERAYTRDRSCYNQLIHEYEEHKDAEDPLFIFNVTIQNHGGFKEKNYPSQVFIENSNKDFSEAEQYLTLIKQSDTALKELIEYFNNEEEPVVILFFGDHWPELGSDYLKYILGVDSDMDMSPEDTMKQYEVPFFIWANYDLEGSSEETTGFNRLSGFLLSAAGLDETPYQRYISEFSESIPVVTGIGMIDKDGNTYLNGDKTEYDDVINKYSVLQYNQMFDKSDKDDELFIPQDFSG